MKTNRDLHLTSLYWSIHVPKGAPVIQVAGNGGGYALRDPRPYGVNDHDATYRYAWVPADAVDDRPTERDQRDLRARRRSRMLARLAK